MSSDRKKNLWSLIEENYLKSDVAALGQSIAAHCEYSQAKTRYTLTPFDLYKSLAYAIRDRMMEHWNDTMQAYYKKNAKRVYYLSMEFLMGRALRNTLLNIGIQDECTEALNQLGYKMEDLAEEEPDAGLGNGGLGRLAACFLDSMATMQLPAYGYGIRYDYGIFEQKIQNGFQVEKPDHWLRFGNPWEIVRPENIFKVHYYGRVNQGQTENGGLITNWVDTEPVIALPYDMPIPGYENHTVNTLRLWSARASEDFDFEQFNRGDYIKAVQDKTLSENITKVLYPKDDQWQGKELRLKQEYFFVSATLQDILRRHKTINPGLDNFSEKVAIQLNDTHPAIAIPELMRLFVDLEKLPWEKAWDITVKTFGYTNHTIMPEALEKWPVDLVTRLLPRHMQIIYEINRRFLDEVSRLYPKDLEKQKRLSIIEEAPVRSVQMAYLAVIGSHSTNGVAALHSRLIQERLFPEFFEIWPERFNNKTNGITQRRWLKLCNPELADLITENIGSSWVHDLDELEKLTPLAESKKFRTAWRKIKLANKKRLADYIKSHQGLEVSLDSLFDCQIKRLHEYKRQLLNVLHIITLYNRIKANPAGKIVSRTFIFGAKAAPGYAMAKLIIKLITAVADKVNCDPDVADRLKVVFLENYKVSLAEKIFPAADLSEQISTAGLEASGTGNMKFALNGALTIGTLDGANVEIQEEVGPENIFIFGLTAEAVVKLKQTGYQPQAYYQNNPELKQVLDMMAGGYFSPDNRDLFQPIIEALLHKGDTYMLLADYASYIECQERVSQTFGDTEEWTRQAILNAAHMGKFSSDRTITEYAKEIWGVLPVKPLSKKDRIT